MHLNILSSRIELWSGLQPVIVCQRVIARRVAGGLMSYGPPLTELFRRGVDYVDRIAKVANPDDLPVEGPRKFELVVNLKTAKALGITIPASILLRADKVIE